MQYKPIDRQRLCTEVSRRLEEIITKEYSIGDRLPPENDLAHLFGVSRNVLREAVKILAERGLLEAKQGIGTFVAQPGLKHVSKALKRFITVTPNCSYQHIYEVRRVLEVGIAKLAATRATEEDICKMEQSLDEMEKNLDSGEKWSKADLGFHNSLADATHNPLFAALLEPITNQLLEVYFITYQVIGSTRSGLHHHRNIIERVAARDAVGAEKAMLAHLEDSERYLISAEETCKRDNKEKTYENL